MIRPVHLSLALVALVGACADTGGDTSEVAVVSNNTECRPAKTDLKAGPITFKVKNEGDKTTELYVYGADDKIVGEVENIGPGTVRKLRVDLTSGPYMLACKPGQTGDGIRKRINVTG